ncbi:MAG: hypothetical protein U0U09_14630 [Cyclobacteriaceae bacterium]
MKSTLVSLFLLLMVISAQSQQNRKINIGIEIDALPYITGGYYGSLWIGHEHLRYRAIITEITTPEFFVEDGFTNNKINAYTAIVDYFFKPDFRKWWVGVGLEYWKGSIQTDARTSTSKYENVITTAGTGYVWKFYKKFYLNPWAALHVRVAGDNKVMVDSQEFNPPVITPEVSLKIGWHL